MRIPRGVRETMRLKEGQEVEATGEGRTELKSVAPRHDLASMVEEMRRLGPDAEPELLDWGPDRGSEILPEDAYSRHGEAALRLKPSAP